MAIKKTHTYEGVTLEPEAPRVGDNVKLTYHGYLAANGADDVYAHMGYGENFDNLSDIKMNRCGNEFEVSFTTLKSGEIGICFRDNWNNWDNNLGMNYKFHVKRATRRKKEQ